MTDRVYWISIDGGRGGDQQFEYYLAYEDARAIMRILSRTSISGVRWVNQEAEYQAGVARERRLRQEEARRESARRANRNFHEFIFEENLRDFTYPTYTPPPTKSDKEKLADLAEIAWEVAKLMDMRKLLRKAQVKCHPDTGGSHEKWIELENLLRSMGR